MPEIRTKAIGSNRARDPYVGLKPRRAIIFSRTNAKALDSVLEEIADVFAMALLIDRQTRWLRV